MRFMLGLFIVFSAMTIVNSAETQPRTKPMGAYNDNSDNPSDNQRVYLFGRKASEIYADTTLSETEKTIRVNNLIVPQDKFMIDVNRKSLVVQEKTFYGRVCYTVEVTIDYGELGMAPLTAYIYTLEKPNSVGINPTIRYGCLVYKVLVSKSRVSPKFTLRLFDRDFADFMAINAKGIQ